MTRFLYIADTHLGADPMGYQQQQGYPQKLPEIVAALGEHLSADGGIDFILHGGDMVDATTDDNLALAAALFDLPVPVHLCLGNHDLTVPGAVHKWLELAPRFFIGGTPDYSIATGDCMIHVAPNQWCDEPFYWESAQQPHFSPAQHERLAHQLAQHPELPHILVTHSPVYGLPVDQTGLDEPLHAPPAPFTAEVAALAEAHPSLQCVLAAHSHMNMRVTQGNADFITVSALVETPFEFKLFEVTPEKIHMTTAALAPALAFNGKYDSDRSFVQGRPLDRSFSRTFVNSSNA